MSSSPGMALNSDWVLDEKVSKIIRCAARKLARSPGFSQSDQPDIEQEFFLLLLQKAAKLDASRSKVTTFAKRLIENKATSMARAVAAPSRSYRRNSISLNEEVRDGNGGISKFCDLFDSSAGVPHVGDDESGPQTDLFSNTAWLDRPNHGPGLVFDTKLPRHIGLIRSSSFVELDSQGQIFRRLAVIERVVNVTGTITLRLRRCCEAPRQPFPVAKNRQVVSGPAF
jgi:hypothetical protein